MKRNLTQLANKLYDLVIVGGGIYGACIAWDAALRGLRASLVEKSDFSSATSANSLKIIHGGLRYLQHADFKRMRESIREQRTLMRIAPHLVHALPVMIPTYGHGIRGKELLSLALVVNDVINFDRNLLSDPKYRRPRGRVISRREALHLLPGIKQEGLTGGGIFYDAQVYNSERLLLSFLRSAEKAGARVANYVEVTGFLQQGNCVTGVKARDVLTGDPFDIRARTVVNTCGPWVNRVLGLLNGRRLEAPVRFAKAINVVTRPLFQTFAVGIPGENHYRDSDAVINKGNRLLFITPWRGLSLVGTAYALYNEDPDDLKVAEKDIQGFLDEINNAYPLAKLRREDVSFVHAGLVPISSVGGENGCVQLTKHYQIRDHRHDGVNGLISVLGVKYTTARHVAEKVVDRIFEAWGQKPPMSISSVTPLHSGQIECFEAFLDAEIQKRPNNLGEEATRHLVYNYGSAYPEVLQYLDRSPDGRPTVTDDAVLKAEILHGIRAEMAQKLSDVIFRRTELGTAGHPGDGAVKRCADIMSAELSWGSLRAQRELQEVNDKFAFAH
jgi:glycerol-3-phosphate dehydrogenase